jgi:hypothetical protein
LTNSRPLDNLKESAFNLVFETVFALGAGRGNGTDQNGIWAVSEALIERERAV